MTHKESPTTYNPINQADSLEALIIPEITQPPLALPSTQFFNDNPEFDPAILIMQLTHE